MTAQFDGVYSVIASAIGGSSIATVKIENGHLIGNDISGSRYAADLSDTGDGNVTFDLQVQMPPNVFGIWGTSPSETVQTRSMAIPLPATVFEGKPFTIPSYDLHLVFRRISDDFEGLAGPNGLQQMIDHLTQVQQIWKNSDGG
ncbi:hypothetical protein NKH37_11275 [Mesorhizobium sp. M1217]|uniref:hypothetical protein n=1 Tax=Mesorhizobium sp. M1217 TaxID=2957070 RepID=UPI00333B3956